ncbi:MAG: DUF1835 domain-containing protein [Clostridium sp.]
MNNIVHICFSKTTSESLKIATSTKLVQNGSIICLLDDLSKGPISYINDITTRVNWNNNFDFLYSHRNTDFISQLTESYNTYYNAINNISTEDIYIWYGDNCLEICGLLYTLTLLNNKTKTMVCRALPTFSDDYNSVSISKGTYEVLPEKLSDIFAKSFKLTSTEVSELIILWNSLVEENTNLRFVNRPNVDHRININGSKENKWPTVLESYFLNPVVAINQIKSANEDYYDNLILKELSSSYIKALQVIGTIIGESNDSISDSFIFHRILHLIKLEKIQYIGDLNSIRTLDISLCP